MNKKLLSLDNKIKNSKCQIAKNIWYYAIAPVVILVVGIILLCTVGFNGGIQMNGGSTFTLYVNNGGEISAPAVQYDIDKDYDEICNKITSILADGNLKVARFQKTEIDIEGVIAGGDAVKVVFLNTSSDNKQIALENEAITSRILAGFGYNSHPEAITSIDRFEGTLSLTWAIALGASIIFAVTLAFVYMAFRTRTASWILGLLHVAFDIALVASLLLICRVPVSTAISAAAIVTALLSMINVFAFYSKAKLNIDNGIFENLKTTKMADIVTKEMALKKCIVYIMLFVIALFLVVWPVGALREIALGVMFALIATFYTSNCVLPAIWAGSYIPAKKKKKVQKEA
ncbi:MAG: hypothetical protein IJY90_01140 [Clostridia bacterium]|nr:hypothetical protein [Clostridia bacterium]